MNRFLHDWGLDRYLGGLPHTLMARVGAPVFLAQCAIVVVAIALAFWFEIMARPAISRAAARSAPRHWADVLARIGQSTAPPLFLLFLLWASAVLGGLFGYELPLVNAAMDLVLAWIFIRLLSFTVRSPVASVAISVVAWSIAALSILGLIDPLIHQLDVSAIHVGKLRLSALTVADAILVLVALLWLTRIVLDFLQRLIERMTTLTPSLQVLLIQLLQIALPASAILIALGTAGIDLTAFTVVFGAVGLGVGLGLQRVASNLVAGLTLLIGKSIKPGDILEYKNSYGWVTAMGARYVTLRTRDGIEHLVPNDYFLENGVENWSHSDQRLRLHVPVGIAYDSDLRQAIALCIEAAKSVSRVIERPEPLCLVKGFGDSSIDLEIRAWIEDPRNGTHNVMSEIMLAVWDRFKEAGIKFPFPQRDVHVVSMPERGPLPR